MHSYYNFRHLVVFSGANAFFLSDLKYYFNFQENNELTISYMKLVSLSFQRFSKIKLENGVLKSTSEFAKFAKYMQLSKPLMFCLEYSHTKGHSSSLFVPTAKFC